MITRGKTDPKVGEYVESDIILLNDLTMHLKSEYMYYTNLNDIPVIRYYMSNNDLYFDYFDSGSNQWIQGGSTTLQGVNRFPQSGSNFIQIDEQFKVYLNDQLKLALSSTNLQLQGQTITGLVASNDPQSAVTLEQLQSVVVGESSDTIISTDLHTRIKCFTDQVQMRVNNIEALYISKPNSSSIILDTQSAQTATLQSSNNEFVLRLKNGLNEQIDLAVRQNKLSINRPVIYGYDTIANPLPEDAVQDKVSIKRDFVSKVSDSVVDMNSFQINRIANGVLSTDAINLGQLPSHQFLFAFKASNQTIISSPETLQFSRDIAPNSLSPAVQPTIQQSNASVFALEAGIYRITVYLIAKYKNSTQFPVQAYIEDSDQITFTTIAQIAQSRIQTSNTDNYTRQVHNQRCFVYRADNQKYIRVRVECEVQYLDYIAEGSSLDIQLLQKI